MRHLSRLAFAPIAALVVGLSAVAPIHAAEPVVLETLDSFSEESVAVNNRVAWYTRHMLEGGVPSAEELDALVADTHAFRDRGVELSTWVRGSVSASRMDGYLKAAARSFTDGARALAHAGTDLRTALDQYDTPSRVYTRLQKADAEVQQSRGAFSTGDNQLVSYAREFSFYNR